MYKYAKSSTKGGLNVKYHRFAARAAAAAVSLATLIGGVSPCIQAFSADETASPETLAAMREDYYSITDDDLRQISYSDYYDLYNTQPRPDCSVTIKGSEFDSVSGSGFSVGSYGSEDDVRDDLLLWQPESGEVSYKVDVPESGVYCIEIDYFPMKSGSPNIELSLRIDGETPYDTATRITLSKTWVNETEIRTDSRGNQIRPPQVQSGRWTSCFFGDIDGLFNEPLFFYLEKGVHTLSFSSEKAGIAIESLTLCNPEKPRSYADYKGSADIGGTPSNLIRLEGENANFKSDSTLCPGYDNTTYLVSPSNPRKLVYNTLGGGNWKKALQSVTWTIPSEEIGSDGWYKIGIKSKQDQMRGFYSNRRIRIDGEVPCEELDCVKFFYDTDWCMVSPKTDSGDNVFVYLTADRDHTITLECTPGEIGDSLRRLDSIVADLNTAYRQIMMITGPAPDKYTDYYVHEKIPTIVDDLGRLSLQLKDVQRSIESLSDSAGSEAAALERMTVILDKCTEKPLRIPNYLAQIKDNITAISAWMRDYRDQPLEVDFIELATADRSFSSVKPKLGKSLAFSWNSFIGSFFEDYTTLSDVSGEDAVNVWVSLGRDQAQVVKEMTESRFMEEYDIPISINLVVGGVVEATLAGKGPDATLFLGGEFPVNLAARGLIADLSEMDGFDEAASHFQENALTPYTYNGGVYGLPISQTFPMMFYRTDVLAELGITSPPETWDELIDMLPALQRNYMNAGLILPSANISPATEAGHTFAMLMLQQGAGYYNDDLSASNLDSIEAVTAFEKWTDFYTDYSFVQTYDAFSRFRTGEYPIVIEDYTFFNQLAAASPEIKGLWNFCPVPGTVRDDGTVSHAANSSGSGAVIFNKCKNIDGAWKFIKWFTGTEAQVEFATQIEGLLGTMGRFDTANTEALEQLSWSADELDRLTAQRDELAEIPIIPSSYAVTRNIMNAFREVVNEGENPRDTLMWYNRDINEEIERKAAKLPRASRCSLASRV